MRSFKFLKGNSMTSYDGEYSLYAITLVQRYIDSRYTSGIRFEAAEAEFVMEEIRYGDGGITSAIVVARPFNLNIKITFYITMGRLSPLITSHQIENI